MSQLIYLKQPPEGHDMPYYTVPRGATVRHRSSDIDPNAISKRYSQAFITDILVILALVWLKLAVLW